MHTNIILFDEYIICLFSTCTYSTYTYTKYYFLNMAFKQLCGKYNLFCLIALKLGDNFPKLKTVLHAIKYIVIPIVTLAAMHHSNILYSSISRLQTTPYNILYFIIYILDTINSLYLWAGILYIHSPNNLSISVCTTYGAHTLYLFVVRSMISRPSANLLLSDWFTVLGDLQFNNSV